MKRLDLVLIARHPELSRRRARDVIEKGQVTVDGALARQPGMLVAEGARLHWDANRKALPRARASLPLLWADDSLVVVDKPAGLLAVATVPEADEDTALRRVKDYARHLHPRRPYVGLVHRLDRDTSGALAFALTPEARDALRALFRAHRIERSYVALVQGQPRGDSGQIDLPIHEGYVSGRRRVARPGEEAMPALTRWRVLERFPTAALLELTLETGRQHQIRVHLAAMGLPVVGDKLYGPDDAIHARAADHDLTDEDLARLELPRHALHACELEIDHPRTGERLALRAPLYPDLQAFWDSMGQ